MGGAALACLVTGEGGGDAVKIPDWRAWLPDLAAGFVVAFIGVVEAVTRSSYYGSDVVGLALVGIGTGAAVALSRHLPAVALALVWTIGLLQVLNGTPVMLVELAIAIVAFGTARWGNLTTSWISALSIPVAAFLIVAFVKSQGIDVLVWLIGTGPAFEAVYRYGSIGRAIAVAAGTALLAVPWLVGLSLRLGARAQNAQVSQEAAEGDAARAVHEREQAREIARLQEEQARLARDVHDVVGHSLAVILAQAESAQYLPEDDPAALKGTMATIATSARSSLQDVRQVLSATSRHPGAPRPGGLDSLVDGVRASGHEVISSQEGAPTPLPPELEVVAVRVLQEMLTNAIKHGRRDQPIWVERHWPDGAFGGDLRIEVRNVEAPREQTPAVEQTLPLLPSPAVARGQDGQGIEGMRRRLESVGGRLDVRRRAEPVGPTFTTTAWVPVRA